MDEKNGEVMWGGAESFLGGQRGPSTLQVCLLSANLSCWHRPSLPGGRSTASDTAPAHPPTRHGAGRNPERQPRVTEHPEGRDWSLNTDPWAPEPRWPELPPGKRASLSPSCCSPECHRCYPMSPMGFVCLSCF